MSILLHLISTELSAHPDTRLDETVNLLNDLILRVSEISEEECGLSPKPYYYIFVIENVHSLSIHFVPLMYECCLCVE
jgi:hypothetical protein